MKLDKAIGRQSAFFFAVFLCLAIVAFWPGYFGRLLGQVDPHLHRHGLSMTLWLVMLISQAILIRKKQYAIHRLVGKASLIVAPWVVYAALDLVHFRFYRIQQFGPESMYALALMTNAMLAFAILYVLAMAFKSQPMIHARYMVCTVLPLVSPVTDRLIYQFFPSLVSSAPVIGRAPIVPFYGFVIADLIVIGLIFWDGFAHKKWNVFPIVLLILLAYHWSVFNLYQFQFWESFGWWFVSLPLE
ncbi:MAG: hypothetical protein JXR10_04360 [Cyclobacteriaceae bacterium]